MEDKDKKAKAYLEKLQRIKDSQNVGPYIRPDHHRLVSRRDFISAGFAAAAATAVTTSLSSLLMPNVSFAQVAEQCLMQQVCGNVPFLTFDAAGGMSIAGANVMVGFGAGEA